MHDRTKLNEQFFFPRVNFATKQLGYKINMITKIVLTLITIYKYKQAYYSRKVIKIWNKNILDKLSSKI